MALSRLAVSIQQIDWLMVLAAMVLFLLGLSAIFSVELSHGSTDYLLIKKQLAALAVGGSLLVIAVFGNYLLLRNWARALYLFGLLLLVLVLIFGTEIRGTTGWFTLLGVSFQPVEFMKFALAVMFARYLGEHASRRFGWRDIFMSGRLLIIPVGLTLLQPDLGSAMLLVGLWVMLIIFAGVRWSHLAVLGVTGLALIVFSWFFVLDTYQHERVLVFINPERDPLARGYNVTQAKIAIGAGQWFGRGLGFGSQSQLKFLPEAQTDFVFAVIAEELGFFGVCLVLFSIALLVARLLILARKAPDNFTAYLALAIAALFFVQSFVNIGVNLAILPATGVALPLVSYGGSSLVMSLLLVGVALSISGRERESAALDLSRPLP